MTTHRPLVACGGGVQACGSRSGELEGVVSRGGISRCCGDHGFCLFSLSEIPCAAPALSWVCRQGTICTATVSGDAIRWLRYSSGTVFFPPRFPRLRVRHDVVASWTIGNGACWNLPCPDSEGSGGVIAEDNRRFINGMLWQLRTGTPWRDLPPDFGSWKNIQRRFCRWRDKGPWETLLEIFIKDPDLEFQEGIRDGRQSP